MKKITFLLACLTLLSWQTNAQILNQAANWPNTAWTVAGTYTAVGLVNDPTAVSDFTFDDDVAGGSSVDTIWATSPTINLTAANTAGEIWITVSGTFNYYALGGDSLDLEYWDADASTWVSFYRFAGNNTTTDYKTCLGLVAYTSSALDISGFTATQLSGFKYRIYYNDNVGWQYGYCLGSPTIVSASPPSCIAPSNLMASFTNTSASLSWTENGTATTWDVEWDTTGFTQGTGTMITGTTTNPQALTGLTPNTSYSFYVRAACGGTNGNSTWAGPFSFFTGYCIPSSSSASTYVDNFSTTNGSTNISNLTSGFTPGGYFDGTAQSVQSFATGTFDFNAVIVGGTAGFSIWIDWNNDLVFNDATEKVFNTTAYGSGPFTGTIIVPTATAIGSYRMRITTDWNQLNPALPCGAQSRAEFEDYTINIIAPPACLAPSALTVANVTATSVDLGWTENGTATTWDIEWDTTGFTQGTGTMITGTTTNPQALTGLTASTSYSFYVRAACGGTNGNSTWTGPFTFTTLCSTFIAPFTESFDTNVTPACWSQSATTGGPWVFGQVGATGYASAIFDDHTANSGYFAWMDFSGTDAGVILEMPNVDITPLMAPQLSFWLASYNTNSNDSNYLFIDAWNGTGWVTVDSIQQDDSVWVQHTYNISTFTYGANLTRFRFRAEPDSVGTSLYYNDLLIDDININGATGINSNVANNVNLNVYPNPTNGLFTLNVNTTNVKELDIKVMNIEGQVVYTKNNFSNINHVNEQVNLNNKAKGIYFVVITSDKGVITRKIIVQ